jgi:hypothetical protein
MQRHSHEINNGWGQFLDFYTDLNNARKEHDDSFVETNYIGEELNEPFVEVNREITSDLFDNYEHDNMSNNLDDNLSQGLLLDSRDSIGGPRPGET